MVQRTPQASLPTNGLVAAPPEQGQPDQCTVRMLLDKLHAHPGLNVGSLVVHRCPSGFCIEGHVQVTDPNINLAALLAEVRMTAPILNRVMVSCPVRCDDTALV